MNEIKTHDTREGWLLAAIELLKPRFEKISAKIPPVRVATGWPSSRGLASKRRVVGECWASEAAKDGVPQIFISPWIGGEEVLGVNGILSTLAHEVVHAVVGHEAKHGPKFRKVALGIGLEGKMTECGFLDTKNEELQPIADALGPFPHAKLDALLRPKKKQGTRMLKCECLADECGFTVRISNKWLTEVGAPHCPKHGAMHYDAPEPGDADVDDADVDDGDEE